MTTCSGPVTTLSFKKMYETWHSPSHTEVPWSLSHLSLQWTSWPRPQDNAIGRHYYHLCFIRNLRFRKEVIGIGGVKT